MLTQILLFRIFGDQDLHFRSESTKHNNNRTMERFRRVGPTIQPLLRGPSLLLYHQVHSTPIIPLIPCLVVRNFSTTLSCRSTNFDTLKVVQRLEAQGFTPEQSKAVMELLKDVIDESILGLTRTMVTREEQDKVPLPSCLMLPLWRVLMLDCISTESGLCTAEK
jgi:hypothetical protein